MAAKNNQNGKLKLFAFFSLYYAVEVKREVLPLIPQPLLLLWT